MVLGLDRGCNRERSGGVEQRVRDIAAGGLVERIELGVEDKKTRTLPSQSNQDVLRLDVDKGEMRSTEKWHTRASRHTQARWWWEAMSWQAEGGRENRVS